MKERPILFSAPMVRAILEGRKTQTRRVVKRAMNNNRAEIKVGGRWVQKHILDPDFPCPYGKPGDRLWVRETWALVPQSAYRQSVGVDQVNKPDCDHDAAVFRAGWDRSAPNRWRPSIHMPRWASRITLEIVSVRVELLNEISEQDALAEGIQRVGEKRLFFGTDKAMGETARIAFSELWKSINGADSWSENTWVWCIEFRRVQ